MAKVMVSFPDELLERLDAQARERGTTRSGLLQELAERELGERAEERRRRLEYLLESVKGDYGGDAVAAIREDRDRL